MFIHHISYILIYFDNILINNSLPQGITSLLHSLNADFAIKDLGPLHFFLGMEAIPISDGLILSQRDMLGPKPIKFPKSTTHLLSLFSDDPFTDSSSYYSLVGALRYLSLTHPNISFAINKVSQFMHQTTSVHLLVVKCILWYFKSITSFVLFLRISPSHTLQAFSNTDWADCLDDT